MRHINTFIAERPEQIMLFQLFTQDEIVYCIANNATVRNAQLKHLYGCARGQ